MSQRREALIARYRVISLERLRTIRTKLPGVAVGNAEALAEVRRELHTLKGDSHLLGLIKIGQVAHACEERLTDPRGLADAANAISSGLDAVKTALADESADHTASDALLAQAMIELGPAASAVAAAPAPAPVREEPAEPAPDAPTVIERKARPEQIRWTQINAQDVDVVVERLSALHADLGRIHASLRGLLAGSRDTLHDLERLRADLDEIVSSAWALRLAPAHPVLDELADHARELAAKQDKKLTIRIDDGGAMVERRLLDEVREPLLHLVRNAVDHGIEHPSERGDKPVPAELVLTAEGRGDQVVITVADDGRGIDYAAVRQMAIQRKLINALAPLPDDAAHEMLFIHGFSTRHDVSDISGRGIGLDAVRRKLLAIGGRVSVSANTAAGAGTRFAIYIPTTVFRERVLIADVGGALCALPAREVEAIIPIASADMESVGSASLLRYRGEGIPFMPLPLYRGDADAKRAAIVTHGGQRWAISLPDVVGDVELLRVPVDAAVASLGPFAASGTLDDGRLVLVVSLDALLSRPRQIAELMPAAISHGRRRVLVVDDSPIVRDLLTELLASVGLEVRSAGNGADALVALAQSPVDLIVCDVEMPVMDGFDFLRKLREKGERVPVVMVTTRGSVADRSLAASLGADALIVKSEFENAHLLETVRRFVEIRA